MRWHSRRQIFPKQHRTHFHVDYFFSPFLDIVFFSLRGRERKRADEKKIFKQFIPHIVARTCKTLWLSETYHLVIEMTWYGHPKTCKYRMYIFAFCSTLNLSYVFRLVDRSLAQNQIAPMQCVNNLKHFFCVSFDYFCEAGVCEFVLCLQQQQQPESLIVPSKTRPMEILTAGQHHIISRFLVSNNVENWILEESIIVWFGVLKPWVWRLSHNQNTKHQQLQKQNSNFVTKQIRDGQAKKSMNYRRKIKWK